MGDQRFSSVIRILGFIGVCLYTIRTHPHSLTLRNESSICNSMEIQTFPINFVQAKISLGYNLSNCRMCLNEFHFLRVINTHSIGERFNRCTTLGCMWRCVSQGAPLHILFHFFCWHFGQTIGIEVKATNHFCCHQFFFVLSLFLLADLPFFSRRQQLPHAFCINCHVSPRIFVM